MLQSQLEKEYIHAPEGIFTPLYSCTDVKPILDADNNIIDYEYIDFVQIKTAQEVYDEWRLAVQSVD